MTGTASLTRRRFLQSMSAFTAGSTLGVTLRQGPAFGTSVAVGQEPPQPLRALADRVGLKIGVYMTNTPRQSLDLQGREFNQGVIWTGWPYSEPQRGTINNTALDVFTKFAQGANMTTRGHMLVWPNNLPDWLRTGGFTNEELISILTEHIDKVMSPYKGIVQEWVVVNEPYAPPFRMNDIFHEAIGPGYIEQAFRTARSIDPSAVLIYNDAQNDTSKTPLTPFTRGMVERLRSANLIDAVGVQAHKKWNDTYDIQDVVSTLQSYGVPVHITEFDVSLNGMPGSTAERFARQATVYADYLGAAVKSGVCKSFTVWGVNDSASVWEARGESDADPLLFTDDFAPKPAYFAMADILRSAAGG